jgi:O-antigen ligase
MNVQKIARWIVVGALFIIPFLVLYTSNSMYFPFITGKNFLFRILVEVATAGWIVLALSDKKYRPRFSWTFAAFGLLVVWMAIADTFAANPHKAFWSNYERMDGWVTLVHVFLFFVVSSAVLGADRLWKKWWTAFITATGLVVAYGFMQLMGMVAIRQSSTRIDSTLGNAEYLAGFMLFAIGATLWRALATSRKQPWVRYGLFFLTALEVIILFKTGTRGTFVGFLVALGVGGLLWLMEAGKQGRKSALTFVAALVILVGGFYSMRDAAFIQNDPNLARIANISFAELGTRVTIWGMAVEGAKERPITGWGHEGFNYVFNKYYEPSLHGQEQWFDRAHSVYLDWLIAGGIPALVLFLALLLSAAWAVFREKDDRVGRILVLSMLAGYAVQGLVVFDNLFTYVPIAALLAYAHLLRAKPIRMFEKAGVVRGSTLQAVAAPASFALALVALYLVNIPSMRAAGDLIGGLTPSAPADVRLNAFKAAIDHGTFATQETREQLLTFAGSLAGQKNIPENVRTDAMTYAAAQMQEELRRAPNDARLHILYATYLRNTGNFEQARAEALRARALSPQKQTIMTEQGAVAWQAGDFAAARDFFAEAYALAPESDEFAVYAAAGRIISGDTKGGRELLTDHFGTTSVGDLILAAAYQTKNDWNGIIEVLRARYAKLQDPKTGYQLAIALAQSGRMNEARVQIRAVMAQHPETATDGASLLTQLGK